MERLTRAGVQAIVLAVTALFLLPLQAQAERNWGVFSRRVCGKAFHSNEDVKINLVQGVGLRPEQRME